MKRNGVAGCLATLLVFVFPLAVAAGLVAWSIRVSLECGDKGGEPYFRGFNYVCVVDGRVVP